jgi:phospholipid/cholesterol/gamma-HCH transport system substrate-binding protein
MDEDKKLELKVGLTIFIAAVVLSVGLLWFQGFEIGKRTYEITAIFPMVGGVDPGDEVNVNGVEKGEVKRVSLEGTSVHIRMAIYSSVKIPDDSKVILQTVGIMGERVVSIMLGESDTYMEPGMTLEGIYDPGMSEVLASLGNITGDMTRLVQDIRTIAEALAEGDDLRKTVENLAIVTGELKELMSKNAPKIEDGITSFSRSAERFDLLLERNEGRIDSIITAVDEASRELPELARRVSAVTEAMNEVVQLFQSEQSTMGALMNNRDLLDRLERTISSLDELVTDMKANPGRYLKIEVF